LPFIKNTKIDNIRYTEAVWAVGFALEQPLHVVALAVFSFLILKRLQHKLKFKPKLINMSITELDRELLTRCLDEQPRAWEDFVDRFIGLVLHIVDYTAIKRNIRISIEDRNTLCENVFAALGYDNYRLLRNFSERSSLTTYLSVVVRRIVIRTLINQTCH
jgi:hypothetical protein